MVIRAKVGGLVGGKKGMCVLVWWRWGVSISSGFALS